MCHCLKPTQEPINSLNSLVFHLTFQYFKHSSANVTDFYLKKNKSQKIKNFLFGEKWQKQFRRVFGGSGVSAVVSSNFDNIHFNISLNPIRKTKLVKH